MNIRHHLSSPILIAYAAGQLPEALSLVVATHVSLCDECRASLMAFDALGGAILDRTETAEARPGRLDGLISEITATPQDKTPIAPQPSADDIFPAPLHAYVRHGSAETKWRSVGFRVRQAIIPTSGRASVRLLSIPPGQSVPDHGHRGIELTLVLQGAFRDGDRRFGRGDVEIATEEDQHKPVAEEGLNCICLAATDAPLRFNTLLPRIAQPFFRI